MRLGPHYKPLNALYRLHLMTGDGSTFSFANAYHELMCLPLVKHGSIWYAEAIEW